MQIALALYPGFTCLDIIGPFQVLVDVPGHDVVFVAGEAGPVIDHTGRCPLVASASFDEVTAPDVVMVPGELLAERDDRLVQWLRQVHAATTWTTSVCTGSLYLAAAGILDGLDATTHWARKEGFRASRRPLHRGAGGRARQGHHRSGRVEWRRHGAHAPGPDAWP